MGCALILTQSQSHWQLSAFWRPQHPKKMENLFHNKHQLMLAAVVEFRWDSRRPPGHMSSMVPSSLKGGAPRFQAK